MRERVLLFPAGPAQREAFEIARNLGYYVVAVDRDSGAPCRELADEFHRLDPGDAEELRAFAQRYHQHHHLAGALVVGCDIPVSWAQVTDLLGTPGPSLEAARLTVDKLAMKRSLRGRSVPVPEFFEVAGEADAAAVLATVARRMIIKPNDNCGARGVRQLTPGADAAAAYRNARGHATDGKVLMEVFEEGPQVSIEALVVDGDVHITGFADRNYEHLERFHPHVIENGATIPSFLPPEAVAEVGKVFVRGVDALGIRCGVAKGDMVYTGQGAKVIEIAGRISGGKFATKLVPEATGVDLLRSALLLVTGHDPEVESLRPSRNLAAAVRYLFPRPGRVARVEGVEAAREVPAVIEVVATYGPGDQIERIRSHADRGGWAVALAETRERAVKATQTALDRVRYVYEDET